LAKKAKIGEIKTKNWYFCGAIVHSLLKKMVLLKFVRKDVILRSVAPFKDDIFDGVVYKCSAQILEEPK
jgi:hypothetical protein